MHPCRTHIADSPGKLDPWISHQRGRNRQAVVLRIRLRGGIENVIGRKNGLHENTVYRGTPLITQPEHNRKRIRQISQRIRPNLQLWYRTENHFEFRPIHCGQDKEFLRFKGIRRRVHQPDAHTVVGHAESSRMCEFPDHLRRVVRLHTDRHGCLYHRTHFRCV